MRIYILIRRYNGGIKYEITSYKSCDAELIASWIKDEDTFLKWGGKKFGTFPISANDIDSKYLNSNGDCIEPDNFYPLTAFNDAGIIGHLILRYIHGDNKILRFGWVILDDSKRGKGCGKEMLSLALKYAFEIIGVNTVTIGVFENNPPAYNCYKALGFRPSTVTSDSFCKIHDQEWKLIELEITKEEYLAKQ